MLRSSRILGSGLGLHGSRNSWSASVKTRLSSVIWNVFACVETNQKPHTAISGESWSRPHNCVVYGFRSKATCSACCSCPWKTFRPVCRKLLSSALNLSNMERLPCNWAKIVLAVHCNALDYTHELEKIVPRSRPVSPSPTAFGETITTLPTGD
jgi:hypothetical protein